MITIDSDDDLLQAAHVMQELDVKTLAAVKDAIIYGLNTANTLTLQCQFLVNESVTDILRWSGLMDI